jgi:uncharacterized protein YidB (DUF937 family)
MSMLDALKQSGVLDQLGQMARENPELAHAARSLFITTDTSVGGSGGLAGILRALESSGLGDAVASWLSGGGNHAVSPGQLHKAMGDDAVAEFSKKAGLGVSAALSILAGLLPQLVDALTPDGQMPQSNQLDDLLGQVFRA